MEELSDHIPRVCFKVEKIVGISSEGTYQVQWAPAWVSRFHLVGCEHLIHEFLERQRAEIEPNTEPETEIDVQEVAIECQEFPEQSEVVKLEPDIQLEDLATDIETRNGWGNISKLTEQPLVEPCNFVLEVKEEDIAATEIGLHAECEPLPVPAKLKSNTSTLNATSEKDSNHSYQYQTSETGVNTNWLDGTGQHQNHLQYSKLYSCDNCGYSCSRKPDLAVHMRTHATDKPFACDACKKSFTTRGSLKSHMYTHTGEKPYPCPYCDSKFTMRCNLRRHLLTHTSERPYKCDQCPKSFSDQSNWKRHKLIHARAEPVAAKETFPGMK